MLQIQAIAFHVIIFSPAFSPILDTRLDLYLGHLSITYTCVNIWHVLIYLNKY